MGPEMLTALSALAVAVVTAAGGIVTAVVGRRQPRGQQRRDDFTAVTDKLGQHIERLERRVTEQDQRLGEQEEENERDRARIAAQDFALRYIASWCRTLVGYMRAQHLEPPPPPQPVPDEVQPYLHDLNT
ncbi:hypothetical protein OG481_02335 [Streptomyces longwoodensis]|uniref:hypothetical protein n=1 Tax=Streptomyces longwoodensis TaxID=68231 RepID=UPI002DD903AB|nr:hypothetical protein [Streptomyces longwoodensis]WRY87432.1 hypothetical protein OG481_02335 [Streptomyces longwoodensis]